MTGRDSRTGFRWERRNGCACKSCPWKGNCLGETWPHWIESRPVDSGHAAPSKVDLSE